MELVVAVALLALVLAFSGIIFKVSIESYRTAAANTEIMQKLRVITDQLNADFRGLQKDAPLMVWFQQDPTDPNQRYDCSEVSFAINGIPCPLAFRIIRVNDKNAVRGHTDDLRGYSKGLTSIL